MARVPLPKPQAGETASYTVQHGNVYVLGFEPGDTMFVRDNEDMRIMFEDGASLRLQNFFSETLQGPLDLELPDGIVVSGRDVAEAMSIVLDDFQTGEASLNSALPSSTDFFEGFGAQHSEHDGMARPELDIVSPSTASSIFDLSGESALLPQPLAPLTDDSYLTSLRILHSPADGDGAFALADVMGEDMLEKADFRTSVFLPPTFEETELLLLQDMLLDVSNPEAEGRAEHMPTFEAIFSPTADPSTNGMDSETFYVLEYHALHTTPSDSMDDGGDQLLLAFLHMGSL